MKPSVAYAIERIRQLAPPTGDARRAMMDDRLSPLAASMGHQPLTNEQLVEEYFNSLPLQNRGIDGTNFVWDNIAPFGKNAMGGYEAAWPGALSAFAESASVPGRLWQGEQMTPDQMQAAAFDLAGIGMAGSFLGAPKGALGAGPVRPDDVAKGIRAYHGSPHTYKAERLVQMPDGSMQYIEGAVDALPDVPMGATVLQDFPLGRQRLDKIGTGEGAQAYGHGLYEAESEGVAKSYRDALAKYQWTPRSEQFKSDWIDANAAEWAEQSGDIDRVADWASAPEDIKQWHTENAAKQFQERYTLDDEFRETVHASDPLPSGSMYEVNINANPDDFLDWDKPLSEQPQIRDRLLAEGRRYRDEVERLTMERDKIASQAPQSASTGDDFADIFAGSDWDGWQRISELNTQIREAELAAASAARRGALYSDTLNREWLDSTMGRNLARGDITRDAVDAIGTADKSEIANILRDAGIPGIRYLDAGSRTAGEGSRNYVVFDDKLVEILRRYGLLPPVAAGGLGLLGGNEAEAGQ